MGLIVMVLATAAGIYFSGFATPTDSFNTVCVSLAGGIVGWLIDAKD